MSPSELYGSQDDDSAFLAVATQVEASQHDDFAPSPRLRKRRRTQPVRQRGGTASDAVSTSDSEEGARGLPINTVASRRSKRAKKRPIGSDDEEPEADTEYYFPGELPGPDERPKNVKHRIHIPRDGAYLEQQVFAHTQVDLDSSPSHFRGAVWKKPAPAVVPAPPVFAAPVARNAATPLARADAGLPRPNPRAGPDVASKQITLRGFGAHGAGQSEAIRSAASSFSVRESDAELAMRLQADEHARADLVQGSRFRDRPVLAKAGTAMPDARQKAATVVEELADLPSDAFLSSSPDISPQRHVITVSSQPRQSQQRSHGVRAPQTGLKQLTVFGAAATQPLTTSQAASKKHSWPLKERVEPATHHQLDATAMETWVYPTNLGTIRDYQFNIVARSLFHNTLVALPTGLGKTFIAATVMLNYYRWTTNAQIVFMAPTKPLIAQQMEACYGIVGIPRHDTVLMTGETTPALRAEEWLEKRVFFMTPQTVINDLKLGTCDPKKIVLVVVDEAHKASGGYAYTEVIAFLHRFNSSFRVLALTATPGGTTDAVQGVINSLGIARVELRTEQSLDIRQYTYEKQTDTEVFELSDEQQLIMDNLSKALQPSVDKLRQQNAYWSRDPMMLTAFGLTQARGKWMSSEAGRKAPMPLKGMVNMLFTVLSKLAHSIGLLKFHGISPFYSGMLEFQKDLEGGQKNSKTAMAIVNSEYFTTMMRLLRGWTNNPDFIGHPKLEYLREVVLNHFLDAGDGRKDSRAPPSSTRIMIFASYRSSTDGICKILKRNEPMVRPHVFVGQAASKGSEGMDQKTQNAVIQDFKSGKYNTLVATSIGEEGLDIGDVDLIICYDASSSPIRMLQRIGRTGRKRIGRVVLLLMKGKEENDYAKAQDGYAYIQKTIADEGKYSYREDQSPRILPKNVQPIVDKRIIEIPVENSQPIDLNEKGRRARGKGKALKRPPKKFHMPDGVRTGFVKASKVDSDGDESDDPAPSKKASTARPQTAKAKKPPPEPIVEVAQLPFLDDVLLNKVEMRELERKYAHTAAEHADVVVRPPDATRFPEALRTLGSTKYVQHGRGARAVAKAMQAIDLVDSETIERMGQALHMSDLEDAGHASIRLAATPDERHVSAQTAMLPRPAPISKPQPARPTARRQTARAEVPTVSPINIPDTGPQATRAIRPAAVAARAVPKPRTTPKAPAKKRPLQRAPSYGSAAAEADESSPEPTPADMRLATQGIDLGSRDTSGEDEPEEPDSDLDDFVVRSDQTIQMASSSQRLPNDTQPPRRRGAQARTLRNRAAARVLGRTRDVLSDIESATEAGDDPIDGLVFDSEGESDSSAVVEEVRLPAKAAGAGARKRRVVGSDSDE